MKDEWGGRRANGSRFGLGGLVPGQILNFGGRVRGGKSSTNENHEYPNERCANGSRFGLGGLVPAADSGFWRAWLWV